VELKQGETTLGGPSVGVLTGVTPGEASFDVDLPMFAPAGVELTLTVEANCIIDNTPGPTNGTGTATATTDPVFEISSDIIPGGDGRAYNEVYEIQYGSGYWWLPTEKMSWGTVKSLYAN